MFYCMTDTRRFVLIGALPTRFCAVLYEIEYKIPIDAIVIIKDVFPELISGNGNPVGGMLPLTTSALITV